MLKPASLRAALECALPELAANPDRLILYIDEGRIHSRYGDSLSFEYRYRLNLVLLDYAHHASAAIVPTTVATMVDVKAMINVLRVAFRTSRFWKSWQYQ